MKRKERSFHTDHLLLTGLFLASIKTFNSMTVVLSLPEFLDTLLTLGMCGCYGLHVLLQKPSFKRLAAYGLAAVIGAYSALRSGDMMGMITLLTCIALAGCDLDRIMDKLLSWNLCFLVLNMGTSLIMALVDGPMGNLIHEYRDGFWDIGWAIHLGYGHKNTMSMHIVNTFLMWLWNHYDSLKPKPLLIFCGCVCLFLFLAFCKTACGVMAVVVIVALCLRFADRKDYPVVKKLAQLAAAIGPACLYLFSVGSVWLYRQGNALAEKLSVLSTGRIRLCATAWDQYGLTFFGHPAEEVALVEERVLLMDNAYLYALVQIGALWAIAFCVAFFLLAWKSKDSRVHLFILCWCMYSVVEIAVFHGLFLIPAMLPALLLAPAGQKKPIPASADTV